MYHSITNSFAHITRRDRRMTGQALLINFTILLQIWGFGFGDDRTGPADESKRTKRVQGWSRQIMGGRFLLFAIL